jgi:hypothetical protein
MNWYLIILSKVALVYICSCFPMISSNEQMSQSVILVFGGHEDFCLSGGNVGAVDNSSNNSYGSINRCKDWQGASKGIEADSWGPVGIANAEVCCPAI